MRRRRRRPLRFDFLKVVIRGANQPDSERATDSLKRRQRAQVKGRCRRSSRGDEKFAIGLKVAVGHVGGVKRGGGAAEAIEKN